MAITDAIHADDSPRTVAMHPSTLAVLLLIALFFGVYYGGKGTVPVLTEPAAATVTAEPDKAPAKK